MSLRALLVIAPLVLIGGGVATSAAAATHASAPSADSVSGVDVVGPTSGVSAAGISSVSRSGKRVTVGFDIAPSTVAVRSGGHALLCSKRAQAARMPVCGTSVSFSARSSCSTVSAYWAGSGVRARTTIGTCAR